jgi:hypothetical protein
MMASPIYFYSPFSPADVSETNNQVLLLLFILKELASHPSRTMEDPVFPLAPFDWTRKGSSLQKLQEHFSLLPRAFPHFASLVPALYENLYRPTEEIVSLLHPFIMACHTNENLLLFLVQHQNELAVKPFLDKICPEGLDALKEKIASNFRKRGYPFTRWTHSSKMF